MTGIYYVNVASPDSVLRHFALGLNVLVGYAGLVSLGHAGLFGIASYATGTCCNSATAPAAITVALLIGIASMAVYAVLSLRSTGHRFHHDHAGARRNSLGLAYRWISLTGGDNGINVPSRPEPFGYSLSGPTTF